MRTQILFSIAFASAIALLVFGGCSKSSPSGPGGSGYGGGGGGGSANQVVIANLAYSPNPLTVPKGTTVTWKNNDNTWHTATADSGSFDTGTINANTTSGGVTFNQTGTFTYYCKHHSMMHGTVVVQ